MIVRCSGGSVSSLLSMDVLRLMLIVGEGGGASVRGRIRACYFGAAMPHLGNVFETYERRARVYPVLFSGPADCFEWGKLAA